MRATLLILLLHLSVLTVVTGATPTTVSYHSRPYLGRGLGVLPTELYLLIEGHLPRDSAAQLSLTHTRAAASLALAPRVRLQKTLTIHGQRLGINHPADPTVTVTPAVIPAPFSLTWPFLAPFVRSVFYRRFILAKLRHSRISPLGYVYPSAETALSAPYPPAAIETEDRPSDDIQAYLNAFQLRDHGLATHLASESLRFRSHLQSIHRALNVTTVEALDAATVLSEVDLVPYAIASGHVDLVLRLVSYLATPTFREGLETMMVDPDQFPGEHLAFAVLLHDPYATQLPRRAGNALSATAATERARQRTLKALARTTLSDLVHSVVLVWAAQGRVKRLVVFLNQLAAWLGPTLAKSATFRSGRLASLALVAGAQAQQSRLVEIFGPKMPRQDIRSLMQQSVALGWNRACQALMRLPGSGPGLLTLLDVPLDNDLPFILSADRPLVYVTYDKPAV
ncbi:hypothetical protein IWQ60_001977 [Tieghemiomyces parasiticus]|uniref:Uncharacterized protein n=1 Tax=Tieghemiomyces parasiticus TaxID=78921 RepID=A0A9W8AC30_9FUNG|nr:hypothetical protein IWQ60_001977 [Tieghemiomyces parasiticus]